MPEYPDEAVQRAAEVMGVHVLLIPSGITVPHPIDACYGVLLRIVAPR